MGWRARFKLDHSNGSERVSMLVSVLSLTNSNVANIELSLVINQRLLLRFEGHD